MKKFLLLPLSTLLFFACQQTPNYTIHGTVDGLGDGTIYLKQRI